MPDQDAKRTQLERTISQVAKGHRAAFDQLYGATSPQIYALCLSILPDRPAAEAVLRDTYLHVWRNAAQYPSIGVPPTTWMLTLAHDKSLEQLRRSRVGAPGGTTAADSKNQLVPLAQGLTPVLPPARARQMIREALGHSAAPLTEDPMERSSVWRQPVPLIAALTVFSALIWWAISSL